MYRVNHLVPEQMFSTETDKAQGISAVKALAIAGQQGQKIWTIDKNNLDLALSKINLGADAESDIRNAVNAGRIATAHESRINYNGWIGEGYILMDPKTGAGAYMISGGGNGGEVVSDILGAGFDLAGLLFGYEQHQNHGSVSAIYRFLGAVFNAVGVVFASIFTIFDISERCKKHRFCGLCIFDGGGKKGIKHDNQYENEEYYGGPYNSGFIVSAFAGLIFRLYTMLSCDRRDDMF